MLENHSLYLNFDVLKVVEEKEFPKAGQMVISFLRKQKNHLKHKYTSTFKGPPSVNPNGW